MSNIFSSPYQQPDIWSFRKEDHGANWTASSQYLTNKVPLSVHAGRSLVISKIEWLFEWCMSHLLPFKTDRISETVVHLHTAKWLYAAVLDEFFTNSERLAMLQKIRPKDRWMADYLQKIASFSQEQDSTQKESQRAEIERMLTEYCSAKGKAIQPGLFAKKKMVPLDLPIKRKFFGEGNLWEIERIIKMQDLRPEQSYRIQTFYRNALKLAKCPQDHEYILNHHRIMKNLKPDLFKFDLISSMDSSVKGKRTLEEFLATEENTLESALTLWLSLGGKKDEVQPYTTLLDWNEESIRFYENLKTPVLEKIQQQNPDSFLHLREALLYQMEFSKKSIECLQHAVKNPKEEWKKYAALLQKEFPLYAEKTEIFQMAHDEFFFSMVEKNREQLLHLERAPLPRKPPHQLQRTKCLGSDLMTLQPLFTRPTRILLLWNELSSQLPPEPEVASVAPVLRKCIRETNEKLRSIQMKKLKTTFNELHFKDIPNHAHSILDQLLGLQGSEMKDEEWLTFLKQHFPSEDERKKLYRIAKHYMMKAEDNPPAYANGKQKKTDLIIQHFKTEKQSAL